MACARKDAIMADYDIVIRGGTVGTASETFMADVGISGGEIAAVGKSLPKGKREIDARGKLVLPGGVDAHAHIEQLSGMGVMNADTFESATSAAAHGGTTTVICFAAQHHGMSLAKVLDDYHALARKGAIVDYAFHMILADPNARVLKEELPALVKAGHSSIKIFMTYEKTRVADEPLLEVMATARELRALVCVHAENDGMISWMGKRLVQRGYTAPRYHGIYHPRLSEVEAFHRIIAFSEFIDQPVIIYHVSTGDGARVIREARGRGVKVFAETCTQYLTLTVEDLDKPGLEGAKWICSPPLRTRADQEALWQALALGDLQLISSDHAPYTFDAQGKLRAGPNPNFKEIANGMPGLELRLPLLFDAMVSKGRFGIERFVEWTATAPARMYGLHPRKGAIAIGADADVCIWDPGKIVTISDEDVHDNTRFTPYAGREVVGWPVVVLRRGEVIVDGGRLAARAGSGRFLPRTGGAAAEPTGCLSPEFDSRRNFGARLY
jgi:dihydropyrimidinase